MSRYPPCADCGAPVKFRDRDRCHVCHRKAAQAALKRPCPRCGRMRHLRPAGICAICDRPATPGRPVKTIACRECGQQRPDAGHGLCNRCKLADPDWPFRYGARLGARLAAVPGWWEALTAFTAARHHPGGAVAILRRAGRVLADEPGAGPRQILAAATREDGTLDATGGAIAVFFTSQGLILPGDEAAGGPGPAGSVTSMRSRPGWPAWSHDSMTASSPTRTGRAGQGGASSAISPWRPGCGSCVTSQAT